MVLQVFEGGAEPILQVYQTWQHSSALAFWVSALSGHSSQAGEQEHGKYFPNFHQLCELQVKAHPVPQVNYGLGDFLKARN